MQVGRPAVDSGSLPAGSSAVADLDARWWVKVLQAVPPARAAGSPDVLLQGRMPVAWAVHEWIGRFGALFAHGERAPPPGLYLRVTSEAEVSLDGPLCGGMRRTGKMDPLDVSMTDQELLEEMSLAVGLIIAANASAGALSQTEVDRCLGLCQEADDVA